MVTIISKQDGPRLEDIPQYRAIQKNRPIIQGLINQLTGGGLSRTAKPQGEPEANSTKSIHVMGSQPASARGQPVVRISLNDRVVIMDNLHARQLLHLGNLRYTDSGKTFFVATKDNGFFSPVDPEIAEVLSDLDGLVLDDAVTEDVLAAEITIRLSLGDSEKTA